MATTITLRECFRCGHSWVGRVEESKVCPKCHSPYFNTPRKNKGSKKPITKG